MTVMVVLVAVLGLAVAALSYRLWKLRQGGTAAILSPAERQGIDQNLTIALR